MKCLDSLLELFFPRECPVCGRALQLREFPVCIYCQADLPLTRFWLQPRNPMADKFNALLEGALPEGAAWVPYVYAMALFFYNGRAGYRLLPQRLKYHADFPIGRYFGAMLGKDILDSPYLPAVSAVVPVPLHWTRRYRRGYNQAAVLARAIASELGCPVVESLVRRSRRTRTQTRLSVSEKARNVAGAFRVSARVLRRLVASGDDLHLLLVDDVFTTGATLLGCYSALRDALDALGLPPQSVRISLSTMAFVGNS